MPKKLLAARYGKNKIGLARSGGAAVYFISGGPGNVMGEEDEVLIALMRDAFNDKLANDPDYAYVLRKEAPGIAVWLGVDAND